MNKVLRRLRVMFKEKSTFAGLITAVGVLGGFTVPDEKVSAAFYIISFISGLFAMGMKENGSEE